MSTRIKLDVDKLMRDHEKLMDEIYLNLHSHSHNRHAPMTPDETAIDAELSALANQYSATSNGLPMRRRKVRR